MEGMTKLAESMKKATAAFRAFSDAMEKLRVETGMEEVTGHDDSDHFDRWPAQLS